MFSKFSSFQVFNFSSFKKHSWSPAFVWHSDIFLIIRLYPFNVPRQTNRIGGWGGGKKNVWMSDKSWEPGMFKCSEQLLFSCVSSKVSICNYVTCRMSYVKCLCWSVGHAEQLLFSCVSSKVIVCHADSRDSSDSWD